MPPPAPTVPPQRHCGCVVFIPDLRGRDRPPGGSISLRRHQLDQWARARGLRVTQNCLHAGQPPTAFDPCHRRLRGPHPLRQFGLRQPGADAGRDQPPCPTPSKAQAALLTHIPPPANPCLRSIMILCLGRDGVNQRRWRPDGPCGYIAGCRRRRPGDRPLDHGFRPPAGLACLRAGAQTSLLGARAIERRLGEIAPIRRL